MNQSKPQSKYLWLGLVLGGLGFIGSLVWQAPQLPNQGNMPVALVNDVAIDRTAYVQQVASLAEDKRNPLSDSDIDYVLQRLIEEELLVQRGLEVQLQVSDRQTRATIVAAMIGMITADANSYQPNEQELRDYFNRHIDYFRTTARLGVLRWHGTKAQLQQAHALLQQGQSWPQALRDQLKVDRLLPSGLLPPSKLRQYLGPTLTEKLLDKPQGYSQLVNDGKGLLYLMDKELAQPPQFDQVRDVVESEYVRRKGERAMREYLDWLTSRADIQLIHKISVAQEQQ